MTANAGNAPSGDGSTADREIVISRLLDAPRELVFQMWTDPNHIGKWWGPRGFTTTTHHIDVRPGGEWKYIMHGPDGRDYDNHITYVEIKAPERIVYNQKGDESFEPYRFTSTITFEDVGGKTRLTMRHVFRTPEARDHVVKEFGAIEGANQTLDRFTEHLVGSACRTSPDIFAIARIVNAPREVVFKVWTEKEHLGKWFGPKGWRADYRSFDFRPGGHAHYRMTNDAGHDMWGKWMIREVTPPQRIVFVSAFADVAGNVARAPFAEGWPLETLSTIDFIEYQGRTLITVRWQPLNASASERDTYLAGMEGMNNGWKGTFEQLTEYLKKL